ncbi:MAG: threonine ammonia-lyase, biosynthetic [Helicobacter sp.]|nr:threonine ammonia-lyase, biosynthetic [Helicobacter sp.]
MLSQSSNLDYIFVQVGGGGLIAGICVILKHFMPEAKIIAVESKDSACLYRALKNGEPSDLEYVGLFADGVAVKRIGDWTFEICKNLVDDVILVDGDEICASMKDIFEDVRAISEPAGALGLAGLKKYVKKHNLKGKKLATILSGANLNFNTLSYVSERCEISEKREVLLAVSMPEAPGSFLKFRQLLGDCFVSEFSYRFCDFKQARVFAGVRLQNEDQKHEIIRDLSENGFEVADLTEDDIVKTHIRYLIGGRSDKTEQLFNFEFRNHSGALLKFLESLGQDWNISLFHYRGHGSDYGNILVGFQADPRDMDKLLSALNSLGYKYENVSDIKSYRYFLT